MNLHNGLESVLYNCSSSSGPCGRDAYAEWESLCWTLTEILGACQREVPFIKHVFFSLVFLKSLVVGECDPDQLVPALNNARFNLYPFGLDILLAFDVYFASDGFSFLEGCLVECDPDLTFGMCEVTK